MTSRLGASWLTAERIKPACDWNSVDWHKAESNVRRLRQRIFRAEKEKDGHKVRQLQKLMLRSQSNRLMAVRRVTQTNQGKNTPGVDHVTVKTPAQRGRLVDALSIKSVTAPVKRIYIPKLNGKMRPLGIPVIRDRAEQAVALNALEPQWEARFEASSYGFRPGRGCHDALVSIHEKAQGGTMYWVLDADVKGAFDNINHAFLLRRIANFPMVNKVKEWLKAGVMVGETFEPSEAGTPQGGVISPLLANIALHGMEWVLPPKRLVRYADDFVVFAKSRHEAQVMKDLIAKWLAKRGLEFSEEKTQIRNIHDGFDFLGCNFRRYYTPHTKKIDRNRFFSSMREGYKILTKPSKASIKRHKAELKKVVEASGGISQEVLIHRLNPKMRGWANYYRPFVSKRAFMEVDNYIWTILWHWARRRHSNKGKVWIANRYWGKFAKDSNNRWIFGYQTEKGHNHYLRLMSFTPIKRHIKVKGDNSKDDPDLMDYWYRRRLKRNKDGLLPGQKALTIFQKGVCLWCKGELNNGERLEVDHIVPLHAGGPDEYTNKQLLHYFCHQQKTYADRSKYKRSRQGTLF